jgi:hypothetical protein
VAERDKESGHTIGKPSVDALVSLSTLIGVRWSMRLDLY